MVTGCCWLHNLHCCCCCSVAQLCPTPCDPTDCSTIGFAVLPISQSLLKVMSIELVILSNHLILCCPLLLPSIFSSIRVFSNDLALCIRWPKYWSFSISPSKEYSGLFEERSDAQSWTTASTLAMAQRTAKDEAQRPLKFQVHQANSQHVALQAGPTRGDNYPSCFFIDFPLQVLFLPSTLTPLFPFPRRKYCC